MARHWHKAWGVVLVALAGCSTSAVQSVMGDSPAAVARERAALHSEAAAQSEPAPQAVETEAAYLSLITELQRNGAWFAALAHLDALELRWPVSPRSQLLRADALRNTGSATESAALYRSLLDGPLAGHAWHGLGLLAVGAQDYGTAVAHLAQARRLLPTHAAVLSDWGFALLHTPQAAHARVPLLQAAQLEPSNVRFQSNVAVYLGLFGAAGEAQAWMQAHRLNEVQRQQIQRQVERLGSLPVPEVSPDAPTQVSQVQTLDATPLSSDR